MIIIILLGLLSCPAFSWGPKTFSPPTACPHTCGGLVKIFLSKGWRPCHGNLYTLKREFEHFRWMTGQAQVLVFFRAWCGRGHPLKKCLRDPLQKLKTMFRPCSLVRHDRCSLFEQSLLWSTTPPRISASRESYFSFDLANSFPYECDKCSRKYVFQPFHLYSKLLVVNNHLRGCEGDDCLTE